MKIYINDHRKLFGVQKAFSAYFPNISLAFFAKSAHAHSQESHHLVNHNKTIGQCRTIHNKGAITITGQMTTNELVYNFRDVFGLHIRLFHKSENSWKEVSLGNHQTLSELSAFPGVVA